MLRPPPTSPLSPSPTLSRSRTSRPVRGRTRLNAAAAPIKRRGRPTSFSRSSRATTARSTTCAASSTPSSTTAARSEEHTSELESQSNLVCRLLLEKKKDHRGNTRGTVLAQTPPPAPGPALEGHSQSPRRARLYCWILAHPRLASSTLSPASLCQL